MNLQEAATFYDKKRAKAAGKHQRTAYDNICEIVRCAEDIRQVTSAMEELSETSKIPARRAIYRRALRELNI